MSARTLVLYCLLMVGLATIVTTTLSKRLVRHHEELLHREQLLDVVLGKSKEAMRKRETPPPREDASQKDGILETAPALRSKKEPEATVSERHKHRVKQQHSYGDTMTTLEVIHTQRHKPKGWPHKRPPLDSLIKDHKDGIIGDVRWTLDFAILGFAKCATSFLMRYLKSHPQVQTWDQEVCNIYDQEPAGLVHRLYTELPEGDYKRGFKCPGHFSRRPMRYFRRYFSKTVLIVGMRHPVKWFESFYNFRRRKGTDLPSPHKLIGECQPGLDLCTDRAKFHQGLAIFGKTNMTNPTEHHLLRMADKYKWITPIDNPVFMYETSQLPVYDRNTTRVQTFTADLKDYLGLEGNMPKAKNETSSRGKVKAINICDREWDEVRAVLVENGRQASTWIRHHFIRSDQVFVSNRDHFESLLKQWHVDPCNVAKTL